MRRVPVIGSRAPAGVRCAACHDTGYFFDADGHGGIHGSAHATTALLIASALDLVSLYATAAATIALGRVLWWVLVTDGPVWIECSWCGRVWPADDDAEFAEATRFCVVCPCPEARDLVADVGAGITDDPDA